MYYPLKFKPLYKDYIWGGRNLTKLGKLLPQGNVAESWELSCHPDGQSIISNGCYMDMSLYELIKKAGTDVVGKGLPSSAIERFPLLIKFIDANDRLSVQVHPEDAYAKIHENGELGKNEMWYILSAKEDAKLVYGITPGTSKESFEKAVNEGRINECLKYVPVKAGDFLNIPAGLVHAIGEGIVLAEVQQNSNTTYRVYDYDRVDKNGNKRPLHVEKALDVIDFSGAQASEKAEGIRYSEDSYEINIKIANTYFAIEHIRLSGQLQEYADGSKFCIYIFTEGSGRIQYEEDSIEVRLGETVLIPAALGKYTVEGNLSAIKTYVPDIELDIYKRLTDKGYQRDFINSKIAGLSYEKPECFSV